MVNEQVNVARLMPMGGFPSPMTQYAGNVGCLEAIADTVGSYPYPTVGGGMCGPMSIFGGGMPFGQGMGGYCGYGPGSEMMYMTMPQARDSMYAMQVGDLNRQVDYTHRLEEAEFRATAGKDVIGEKIGILHTLIKENNQDQVYDAYGSLLNAVRDKYKEVNHVEPNEEQVKAYAKKLYGQSAVGMSIADDLHTHGDSPFWAGFKKALGGLGWAFMAHKTSAENVNEIEGIAETRKEKAQELAGMAVSVFLSVVGAVLLGKGYKALTKTSASAAKGTKAGATSATHSAPSAPPAPAVPPAVPPTPVAPAAAAAPVVAAVKTPEQEIAELRTYAKGLEAHVGKEVNKPADMVAQLFGQDALNPYIGDVTKYPATQYYADAMKKIFEKEKQQLAAQHAAIMGTAPVVTPPVATP